MHTLAQRRMTADEFLAWAEGRDGRWELLNGVPYRMPSGQAGHIDVKYAVYFALQRALLKAGVPCHLQGDGASIRISQHLVYGPDALIYCGPKMPSDGLEAPDPVVLVEVASPSTRKMDETVKLRDYFSLPSVQHYLLVDHEGPPVIHYRRQGDGAPLRSIVHEGMLTLAPPGIEVPVAELFAMA